MCVTQSLNGQTETHELAKTHVEGFRKAAYDLESFIEQQSKQTEILISTIEAESSPSVRTIGDFNKTAISGFRAKMPADSEFQPACFCVKSGICKKHSVFMPTIDTMVDLLEVQINEINADEQRIGDNLDFVSRSMESVLITRKDTFKEQINRAYAKKDDELTEAKMKIADMEERDIDYHQVVEERDALLAHNQQLIEELNAIKSQNKRQGETMKAAVNEVK